MSQFESSSTEAPSIIIRDIEQVPEMRDLEALQKEVWGSDDRDVVPHTLFVASKEVGAVLVGAYDLSTLVGFVYGFVGFESGHIVHHSHMLAVKSSYRNFNLGYKLKSAQRDRVLAQDITRITWTFDPLQSLNAYFNFRKLGVVADNYKINFYGERTSSFLHQIGTDRLWVTWLLKSKRLSGRLEAGTSEKYFLPELDRIPSLVQVGVNDLPQMNESSGIIGEEHLLIEIPDDINALQLERPDLALRWREATRWAFTEAIANEYLVEDFFRSTRGDQTFGVYLLSHRKKLEDVI